MWYIVDVKLGPLSTRSYPTNGLVSKDSYRFLKVCWQLYCSAAGEKSNLTEKRRTFDAELTPTGGFPRGEIRVTIIQA